MIDDVPASVAESKHQRGHTQHVGKRSSIGPPEESPVTGYREIQPCSDGVDIGIDDAEGSPVNRQVELLAVI